MGGACVGVVKGGNWGKGYWRLAKGSTAFLGSVVGVKALLHQRSVFGPLVRGRGPLSLSLQYLSLWSVPISIKVGISCALFSFFFPTKKVKRDFYIFVVISALPLTTTLPHTHILSSPLSLLTTLTWNVNIPFSHLTSPS